MSRGVTTDYFGRAGDNLSLAGSQPNNVLSVEKGTDERDDIEQIETYGALSNPSVDYSVKGNVALEVFVLGALAEGYFLTGFTVNTSAGAQPKMTVNGGNAPEGDTEGYTYVPPAYALTKDWAAQILFSAFTLTGAGCHVKSCSAKAAATFGRGVDGLDEPNCTNLSGASLEVTAEIEQLGAIAPEIAPAEGWKITSPFDPKEDTKTYKKGTATYSGS